MGQSICANVRQGVQLGAKNPKIKLQWLGLGSAMSNSMGERWLVVVAWPVQSNGSCRVVCLQMRGEGCGWVPKTPKMSCGGSVSDLLCNKETGGGRGSSVGSQNSSTMVF